jgi:hypothetical protein
MRGCKSSGALELSAEMRLAHAGSVRITAQIEIAYQLLLHQIRYVPEEISRNGDPTAKAGALRIRVTPYDMDRYCLRNALQH